MIKSGVLCKCSALIGGIFLAPAAFAGSAAPPITVFWEGLAAPALPVPTIGTIGLMVIAILLAVAGFRVLKANPASGKALGMLLVAGSVLFSVKGVTLTPPIFTIETPEDCIGGDFSYPLTVPAELVNGCDRPVKVVDYVQFATPICASFMDSCPIGTELGVGESCTLNHYVLEACED